jgi:hypothetical protein
MQRPVCDGFPQPRPIDMSILARPQYAGLALAGAVLGAALAFRGLRLRAAGRSERADHAALRGRGMIQFGLWVLAASLVLGAGALGAY